MTDKLRPVKGYFKIEQIDKDGNVLSTYEDPNTVMARIPELLAGQVSGMYVKDISKYSISTIALGTDGSYKDTLGNDIPKNIDDRRTQMFSEHNFWDTEDRDSRGEVPISDALKRVFQMTFTVNPRGDKNQNTSSLLKLDSVTQGCTVPYYHPIDNPADINIPSQVNYYPKNYVGAAPSNDYEQFRGSNANLGREIRYSFTLDVSAGNNPNNLPVSYNEAAMYIKLDSSDDGRPLGQLFSMKTFKPVFKDNTCALRIEWNLFF